jgi:two-component system, chemotaxis family, CheB/CheR fusion protein
METGTAAPTPNRQDNFLVVGIGASAGGVEALQEFFSHVPSASGMAYVVILHLTPDYDSQLAQVIQMVTSIPVTKVTEQVLVEPDHIYVIPPNQHLMMVDGHITVSPNTQIEERRAPVDIFFRTLAESHDGRAVGIILSGTGANGSMGLKRIKERGGVVFVQNPREASFNEMPRSAIATGLVDDVLSVVEMPERILAYASNLGVLSIPVEVEQRSQAQQEVLREIFIQLRLRTGHDFSNYKRPTLLRRIERRINIRDLPSLAAYAAFLRDNPEETQALLKDMLISVTNFFRDRRVFDELDMEILPRILHGKNADSHIRIWVVGCATGEEAYTVAMLCAERTIGVIDSPKVQIFATDIDEAALAYAREGFYTLNDAADVSPERLRRFFNKEGDGYRIHRDIREMVLFANHNILKDPPFSHLDLVTCRNLMIYFNPTAQQRVLETLHFALEPGGYLVLGTSETADSENDLFAVVSRELHIYQSRQTGLRSYPVPEAVPLLRLPSPYVAPPVVSPEQRVLERITYGDLHQRLLEQYAPPSVVINEEYDIVHLSERAGRYMQIAGGEPTNNLLKLIRPELRLDLRTALYQAIQRRTNVEARNLQVQVDEHLENVDIIVRPVLQTDDTARGFLLVLFEQSWQAKEDSEAVFRSDEPITRQLEEELIRIRAQVRASSEQYEFQAEELKAANEELQAMNEELRSAAEELETSKEELQSINEELRTVNQELKVKIEETIQVSNNLQNLVNSTDIGTIFLDRSLRVALFTPAAREIFNLIPADYGRPLSDITHRLAQVNVIADAEAVLNKLQPIEREVYTTDERVFLMRMVPYRTAEDRINGVVVTFVGITERKRAEEAMRSSEERLRVALEELQRVNEALESRVQERTAALTATNVALEEEISVRKQVEAHRAVLLQRIITAQEDERRRIARELHDTLGQFLSALDLRLALISSGEKVPEEARQELAQLLPLIRQIDEEVDRLTMELRPPALEHLGLPDAIGRYSQEWMARSQIAIEVVATGFNSVRLPSVVETTAYRVIQEALTNILKHARATSVSLIMERKNDALRVIVEDNGVGFDDPSARAKAAGGQQMGLLGMMERATLAGGTLTIESTPGSGTTVFLDIPLYGDERNSEKIHDGVSS